MARVERDASGAANVTITNGDSAKGGWDLHVDHGSAQRKTGKTAAVTNLAPGIHHFAVTGTINGQASRAETTAPVPPGGIVKVELTL